MGSVTPDNIVVRLGPEYGNVLPSECFFRISDPSNCLILVICVVMIMYQSNQHLAIINKRSYLSLLLSLKEFPILGFHM
jgi:hypothetical protein